MKTKNILFLAFVAATLTSCSAKTNIANNNNLNDDEYTHTEEEIKIAHEARDVIFKGYRMARIDDDLNENPENKKYLRCINIERENNEIKELHFIKLDGWKVKARKVKVKLRNVFRTKAQELCDGPYRFTVKNYGKNKKGKNILLPISDWN